MNPWVLKRQPNNEYTRVPGLSSTVMSIKMIFTLFKTSALIGSGPLGNNAPRGHANPLDASPFSISVENEEKLHIRRLCQHNANLWGATAHLSCPEILPLNSLEETVAHHFYWAGRAPETKHESYLMKDNILDILSKMYDRATQPLASSKGGGPEDEVGCEMEDEEELGIHRDPSDPSLLILRVRLGVQPSVTRPNYVIEVQADFSHEPVLDDDVEEEKCMMCLRNRPNYAFQCEANHRGLCRPCFILYGSEYNHTRGIPKEVRQQYNREIQAGSFPFNTQRGPSFHGSKCPYCRSSSYVEGSLSDLIEICQETVPSPSASPSPSSPSLALRLRVPSPESFAGFLPIIPTSPEDPPSF